MSRLILSSAIMTLTLALSACSTVQPLEGLDIPEAPQMPPDTYLEPCPASLQTLPENRAVGQTEAWQTVISWAADYHDCKTRHAYLSGWVAGQAVKPKPEPEKPKGKFLGLF